MGPTLRRFNRYREALPYARAASDMNERTAATARDSKGKALKDDAVKADCLTRVPVEASALSKKLGLKENAIQDQDLRNEVTGSRAAMYRDEATVS